MKYIFFVISLLSVISCYAQNTTNSKTDNNSNSSKNSESWQQQSLNQDMSDSFKNYLDEFMTVVQERNYSEIYEMADEELHKIQSEEDIKLIFEMYNRHYGKIENYEFVSAWQVNQDTNEFLRMRYHLEFKNYKGTANGIFKIHGDSLKMFGFSYTVADYAFVLSLDSIAQPVLKAIEQKNIKQIYDLTSSLFKGSVSRDEFEAEARKMLEVDIQKLKMFQNKLFRKNGQKFMIIVYEINDNSGLQLAYSQVGDTFQLDGINYIPFQPEE